MNGRFDLINKALSTASTGYQNRKSIMALQSAIIDNMRRVASGSRVIQLLYGDDGLDARKVEYVKFRSVALGDEALAAAYRLDLAGAGVPGAGPKPQAVLDEAFALVRADRDWYRAVFRRVENSDFDSPMSFSRQMPVNVAQVVRDVLLRAEAAGAAPAAPDAAALAAMSQRVADFCGRVPYFLINEIQEARRHEPGRPPVPERVAAATGLFQMLLRAELAGPVLARLTPDQLGFVLDTVRLQYAEALVDYGTAAGILAAQAVSEFFTQYMLDSHHRSVGGGTNKSGIVRPAEIFGAKAVKDELSSEMLLRVLPEFEHDRALVLPIANQIEVMRFSRFVGRWDLLVEPFGRPVYPEFAGDAAWIDEFLRAHPLLPPPVDLTTWCVRFVLDKSTLVLKSMDLETILERVRAIHPFAFVIHSPENSAAVVLRVYFREGQFRRDALGEAKVLELVRGPFMATPIRGVQGILTAEVVEVKRHRALPDGSFQLAPVFAIRTAGTNVEGALLNRKIDPLRVVSSSIGDTLKMYGIAAAQAAIVREVRRLMGEKAPNLRHILIYAAEMTRTGCVTSLEKGGVAIRERDNVFLRMAMSAPTQVLQEAAVRGTKCRVQGIAPYLMLGRTPRLGTTWNSFIMDDAFIAENSRSVDDALDAL